MVSVFFFSLCLLHFISVFSDEQRLYFGDLVLQDLSVGCFPLHTLISVSFEKVIFSGMPELFLVFHVDL